MFSWKRVLTALLPVAVVWPLSLGAAEAPPPKTFFEEAMLFTEAENHLGAAVAKQDGVIVAGSGLEDYAEIFVRDASGSWQEYLQTFQRLEPPDATTEICTDPVSHICHEDEFGDELAISGDYILAGAAANKVQGEGAGAAYVYRRAASGFWKLDGRLDPPTPGPGNAFGSSVDIEGRVALVGAPGAYELAGAIYAFERRRGSWRVVQTIIGERSEGLGRDVALDGDQFLVRSDERALVFARGTNGKWTLAAELDADVGTRRALYAPNLVALEGDMAAVSEDGDPGTVAVFNKLEGVWTRTQTLASPFPAGDYSSYGCAVSLGDAVLVVGDCRGSLIPLDDDWLASGLAHVYDRVEAQWIYRETLDIGEVRGYSADSAYFGGAVHLDGSELVIGAPLYLVSGGEGDGAVFVYRDLPPLENLQRHVIFEPDASSFVFSGYTGGGCPAGTVGTFGFTATLGNTSQHRLEHLHLDIAELTGGNRLLVAENLLGAGDRMAVPEHGDYADGELGPGESMDMPFTVCLESRKAFRFFVDVMGHTVVEASGDSSR